MPIPEGLKDALAREGTNMMYGAQEAHAAMMGQATGVDQSHIPHVEWDELPAWGPDTELGPAPASEMDKLGAQLQAYDFPPYEPPALGSEKPPPTIDNAPSKDIDMDR